MKRIRFSFSATLTLVILLTATKGSAQTYTYEQILSKADSTVRTQVNQDLLKYFHRDSVVIKYDFRRPHWRKYLNRQGEIRKGEKTKGHFQYALIYYNFYFKEPVINADLHKGYLTFSIDILFDSRLNPRFCQGDPSDFNFDSPGQTHVDLSFIPAYVKENRTCDFIPMQRAIEIGKQANIKNGIEPITATLDYDGGDLKRYCWWINSPLTREKHDDHIHGEADTVTIDAVTGKVISHNTTTYGAMH
jgi:hypothetical protein